MKKKSTIEVEDTAQLIKMNEKLNKENLKLNTYNKSLETGIVNRDALNTKYFEEINGCVNSFHNLKDKYNELKTEYNAKDDELTKNYEEIEKLKSEILEKRSELMVANSMHTVAIEKTQELDKMKKDFEQTLSQVGVLEREKKELQEILDNSDFFVKHFQSIIEGNNSSLRSLECERNLWIVLGGTAVFISLIILAHAIFG